VPNQIAEPVQSGQATPDGVNGGRCDAQSRCPTSLETTRWRLPRTENDPVPVLEFEPSFTLPDTRGGPQEVSRSVECQAT
jgi:hypothetical protein